MNLLEYEAKTLLATHGISIPASKHISAKKIPVFLKPVILKSQVPTGGRGKAGGVVRVDSAEEFAPIVERLLALEINGHTPQTLLAETPVEFTRELYLSLMIDREAGGIALLAHARGGIEVEKQAEPPLKQPITAGNLESLATTLAEYYHAETLEFALHDLLTQLYRCFTTEDATLIEINPLFVTTDNQLIAGDCKMTLDPAASFRHPEWNFEITPPNANFVTLNPRGTVATIANGAGLAMATVDAVASRGLTPANFLDIGGKATVESVLESFRTIQALPSARAIIINIFGGIVRCDTVAEAIIAAQAQLDDLPPLYIRLSGTNAVEAADILARVNLPLYASLDDCLEALPS